MTAPTVTATLDLPWRTPPLSLNDRGHYMARARRVAEVRSTVFLLALAEKLPRGLDHVTVQLNYRPRDNRRRDPINITATQKAAVDALTLGTRKAPGFGLVPDDTPQFVTDLMPRIHPAIKGEPGRLWLELAWDSP